MNSQETIAQIRDRCLRSFADFCMFMQDEGYFDPVHRKLCDWMQYHYTQYLAGEMDYHLKMGIVMPRGALKTTMVTKYFVIWLSLPREGGIGTNLRSLIASNTISNARKKLADIRGLFDNNTLFRTCFPEILPSAQETWNNESACLPRETAFPESTFEAAGMKTKKTGTHYNVIVEDDTVAPDESEQTEDVTVPSQETIEKGIGWHKKATSLMVPKGIGLRIVVTTRWAEEDLIYHIEKKEHYKIFDIPATNEHGEPYFTNFYSKTKLEDIRLAIGDYMFSCLYLNKPLPRGKRAFQREWFITVPKRDVPDGGDITLAIDPAISKKDEACETSITSVRHVLHRDGRRYQYWDWEAAGHFTPFDTTKKVLDYCEEEDRWKRVKEVIVENVAFQESLRYTLRDELIRRNNVRIGEGKEEMKIYFAGFSSRTRKEVRIAGMQPLFQNGRILFVQGAVSEQTKSQLIQFPHGKLVDRIDCFSMHRYAKYGEERVKKEKVQHRELDNTFGTAVDELRARAKKGSSYYSKPRAGSGMDMGLGLPEQVQMEFAHVN